MKKLSRTEMKNVLGGNAPVEGRHTECWDCGSTQGVYCTSVSNDYECRDAGGVSGIYLTCSNGNNALFFGCGAN